MSDVSIETSSPKKAEKAKQCRAVLCEDPKTGKITMRFGRCNREERARIAAKIATEGLGIDANEDADEEKTDGDDAR